MNQGSTQARLLHDSDSLGLARLLGIWLMQYAREAPVRVTAQPETTDTL
jgi:hypothetical protein